VRLVRNRRELFTKLYKGAALLVFNTLLLFIGLNGCLALISMLRHRFSDAQYGPTVQRYGLRYVATAYPGWTPADLKVLLRETTRIRSDYEPFTTLRPELLAGRFINLGPSGYRNGSEQCPWPVEHGTTNIFVFGGSTAFGVGVADSDTIPSRLQHHLRQVTGKHICVYNFARPAYASANERILFQQLLLDRHKPDLAVFIDGLNEFRTDDMTEPLRNMVRQETHPDWRGATLQFLRTLPVGRAARLAQRREGLPVPAENPIAVVDRWIANVRMVRAIAAQFGVRTLFVWQPVPSYGYDLRYHAFSQLVPAGWWGTPGWAYVSSQAGNLGDDFLWLGDLQRGERRNLYVDSFHYNAPFCDRIAMAIAARLQRDLPASR